MAASGSSGTSIINVDGTYSVSDGSVTVIYQDGNKLTMHSSRRGVSDCKLSGNTITFKMMFIKITGQFDHGVINWSTGHVSTRTGPPPQDPKEATKLDEAWHPGKGFHKLARKVEQAVRQVKDAKRSGDFEEPSHPLLATHNALKGKRALSQRHSDDINVGTIKVTIIRGTFTTKRPYFMLEMDGNEARTAAAKTSTPVWGEGSLPKAEFLFPVYDPSSDLRLFLCDDDSVRNEDALGRVIIPVKSLCTTGVLPKPLPQQHLQCEVMPAHRQWSKDLEARYREAVPHCPGSGMVKPKTVLGVVEVLIEFELTVPGSSSFGLLAAYAQVTPPGEVELPTDQNSDKKSPPPLKDKIIRGNIHRLKRMMTKPYLLKQPNVFVLPVINFFVCFWSEPYHLPWMFFAIVVSAGVLDSLNKEDRTRDMIYWEDAVGENDMPEGLEKLKALKNGVAGLQQAIGVAGDTIARGKNFWNFAEPPVTLVAIVAFGFCTALMSIILYVFSLRLVFFVAISLGLMPFLLPQKSPSDADTLDSQLDGNGAEASLLGANSQDENCFQKNLRMIRNVLNRVPDYKDIAHEHFCEMQVQKVTADQITSQHAVTAV